jgi:hypothetical protein
VDRETRDLIRQMNAANPLWGAPRIHGDLLKLGIAVSQATVTRYMLHRAGAPSPRWRSFLRNHVDGIAAIDIFVMASASFRLLYVMVILGHDRRKIVRLDVTQHPTAGWLSRQLTETFPWDTAPDPAKILTFPQHRAPRSGVRPSQLLCRRLIVAGQAQSVREIARREKVADRYVRELLPLGFLAPKIVEAIVEGRQPPELTVIQLIRRLELHVLWSAQEQVVGLR